MFSRAKPRPSLSPLDLPTLIVRRVPRLLRRLEINYDADANQFKDAFIKAQKENEAIISKESPETEEKTE